MRFQTRIVLISLMLVSCTKHELLLLDSTNNDSIQYNWANTTKTINDDEIGAYELIKDGYIEFFDNKYSITISQNEAILLGYSESGYELLKNQLHLANNILDTKIAEWDKDPSIKKYDLIDCTYDAISIPSEYTGTISRNATPQGTIKATLGAPDYAYFFAPLEMRGVTGHCYNYGSLVAFNLVETNFFGDVQSKFRLGNGELSVEISASNTYGTLTYTTSDSNGGIYSWQGYPRI